VTTQTAVSGATFVPPGRSAPYVDWRDPTTSTGSTDTPEAIRA